MGKSETVLTQPEVTPEARRGESVILPWDAWRLQTLAFLFEGSNPS